MRAIVAVFILFLPTWLTLGFAEEHAIGKDGYELHEWGVFTVPRNDAWAQRDMRAEWASLPDFFYRAWPDSKLPYRGPVRKPVIFLHADKAQDVALTVRFAEGRPLVWWPADQLHGTGAGPGPVDRLEFRVRLVEMVADRFDRAPDKAPDVEAGHWIGNLRAVKSATLFAAGSHSKLGTKIDRDNFIYYDGLMKAPPSPKVTRDGDAIVLETASDHALLDVMVLEHDADGLRGAQAWTERIDAGVEKTRIAWKDRNACKSLAGTLDWLRRTLTARLEAAGLHADEARSLVQTWDAGLFHQEGITVFYRVPQETYEKWLPLEASPAPRKTVRVGLVVHEHMEPELDDRVKALIGKLGAEKFEERDAARQALERIGGAAFPQLEKYIALSNTRMNPIPEIYRACQNMLNALDALPALKAPAGK